MIAGTDLRDHANGVRAKVNDRLTWLVRGRGRLLPLFPRINQFAIVDLPGMKIFFEKSEPGGKHAA